MQATNLRKNRPTHVNCSIIIDFFCARSCCIKHTILVCVIRYLLLEAFFRSWFCIRIKAFIRSAPNKVVTGRKHKSCIHGTVRWRIGGYVITCALWFHASWLLYWSEKSHRRWWMISLNQSINFFLTSHSSTLNFCSFLFLSFLPIFNFLLSCRSVWLGNCLWLWILTLQNTLFLLHFIIVYFDFK